MFVTTNLTKSKTKKKESLKFKVNKKGKTEQKSNAMRSLLAQRQRDVLQTLVKQKFIISSVRCFAGTNPPETSQHYDIIIGGGGLVGTTLAAALSANKTLQSKRVLLLEGAPPFKGFSATAEYGNRVSAINSKTVELFKSIGAWDHIVNSRVKAVKQMQVWDASSDALIQFQHDEFAKDVAYIVENDLILDAVYSLITKSHNVVLRNDARIEQVKLPADTEKNIALVTLKNGEKFTSDLIVGADGANSVVRNAMGVDVYSMNYERMGLVATLELEDAGDNSVAWQRFLPTGPVALLPLNETMSSLVWSTTIPHAKELLNLSADKFVDEVNHAYCREFPKDEFVVKAVGALNSVMGRNRAQYLQYPPHVRNVIDKSRAVFPLGFLHASSYVNSGAALIGDAAHRIHPLAGQGVNLGFSDVCYLVECLAEGAYSGAKTGDKKYLLRYEQKCLTNNVPIMIGVHGLHNLYSTTFSPVVFLRSIGLQLTDNIPLIKNMFMRRAIG